MNLVIPGQPVPKGRPRARAIRKKSGATFVQIYTDKKTVEYESRVASVVLSEGPVAALEGPLVLHVVAILKRPQRLLRKKDKDGLIPAHCSRIDLDNIVKSVSDGLQRAGVVQDDKQITEIRAWKFYAEKQGEPRTEVVLEELNDE